MNEQSPTPKDFKQRRVEVLGNTELTDAEQKLVEALSEIQIQFNDLPNPNTTDLLLETESDPERLIRQLKQIVFSRVVERQSKNRLLLYYPRGL